MKKELMTTLVLSLLLFGCSNKTTSSETTSKSSQATTQTVTTQSTTSTTVATTQNNPTPNGIADTSLGLDIVVNKKHALPADYAPGENPTAVAQLKKLIHKMQELGYPINNSYSGYRSYEYQTKLYNNYVAQEGQKAADTYSARPGYSEHQTGLAFDILDSSGNLLEGDQYKDAIHWLHTHAHEYGFIVRFQEGKEAITGYIPEAWHLRYIGDKATDIYNSGLSLEEYFGVAGGDYE